MNVFIVSIPNNKEREIWEFEMDFKNFFLSLFYINLSNNDIISWRQGLKSGIEARSVSGRKNVFFFGLNRVRI